MIVLSTNKTLLTTSAVISTLLGFAALVWPEISATVLAAIIGVFFLAESLLSLLSRGHPVLFTWSSVFQGLVGLVVGLLLIVFPGTALRVVVLIMAVWLVIRGILQAALALRHRHITGAPAFLAAVAGISVLVGGLLIFRPGAGIIAFAWLLGIYAILSGVMAFLWGRRAARSRPTETADATVDETPANEESTEPGPDPGADQ